jgi:Tfp pilus assembly protein PilN
MADINLIPGDVLEQRQRLTRLRLWGVGVTVLLLLLPVSGLVLQHYTAGVEQRVARLAQHRTELMQRLSQLKALRQRQQQLQARAQIIDSLYARVPLQQLFYHLATLSDEHLWLLHMQLRKAPESTPTGAAPPSRQPPQTAFFTLGKATPAARLPQTLTHSTAVVLTVQGYTTSNQRLADFMSKLAAVPHLSKVHLLVARRGVFQSQEAVEFVIELHT